MKKLFFIHIPLLVLLLHSCSENRLEVDTSDVDIEYKSKRFDRDLFTADFKNASSEYQRLSQEYPEFYPLYCEFVLRVGSADSLSTFKSLEGFTNDDFMHETYEAIQKVHAEKQIDEYDNQLEEAFKHYSYYFPDSIVPTVVYHHSGFNFGVISADSTIAIGLEWFLGKDNKVIGQLPFPAYRKAKMRPDYLAINAVKDWANHTYYQETDEMNLIEQMIYYGKIMYLVDAFAPTVEDSLKMNYTTPQIQWVETNEFKVWEQLANQKTLFEDKPFEVQKWFSDGPFTATLPHESPPMVGIWMGWQMVRDYMNRKDEVSIRQMLEIEDPQIFLNEYNPRK
jgi:hypothetical protein